MEGIPEEPSPASAAPTAAPAAPPAPKTAPSPIIPNASWSPWADAAAKAGYFRSVILHTLEVLVLTGLGIWIVIGLVRHGTETGWTLKGLLTMLHEQWRGAIILGALLFYGTLREALDRVKLTKFKALGTEFEVESEDVMTPGKEDQK